MNVLSLFDGISCARVALERAGIPVETYFASEIEISAVQVSRHNWPNIVQVGDVRHVTRKHLDIMAGKRNVKIDLLIGGSPCQDLSRAKLRRQGLKGERSGLFYEYLRILRELKPRYFVLENVASMSRADREEITRELGVEPIMIDAALVSAQSRKRYFWTNIKGIQLPEDRGIMLKDILEDGHPMANKARTLTASYGRNQPSANKIGTRFEKTMVSLKPVRLGNLEGVKDGQSSRVYDPAGKSTTLNANGGGGGAHTGLYKVAGGGDRSWSRAQAEQFSSGKRPKRATRSRTRATASTSDTRTQRPGAGASGKKLKTL